MFPACVRPFSVDGAHTRSRADTCSRDISIENTAAVFSSATVRAIFNAKDVLPIPGRAANRIRPDIFKPEIFLKMSSVSIAFLHN